MPKYSFIVPVYNCGPWLVPCVESLLAQTVRDFEILLVNDGTPDDGGAVSDMLAAKYECVRTFHKENGGAASARNYGIDRAEGEYLLFIDGDDTIEPDTLERIGAAAGGRELVIYGISFDYYGKGTDPERVELLSVKHPGPHAKEFYTENLRALFEDNALSSACNKVFSARILRENGLRFREDMTLYEDLEFVLRYFAHVRQFCCVGGGLYHYRIDTANFAHKRAQELGRMRANLNMLAGTMLDQVPLPGDAAGVTARLYMQLLLRHLLVTAYRKETLAPVWDYGRDSGLRRALETGVSLTGQEAVLMDMVASRDGKRLLSWLRKKRAGIALRRTAKQALRILGLRR